MRTSLQSPIEDARGVLARDLPPHLYVVVGYPRRSDGKLLNAAGVLHGGQVIAEYAKQCLPNYQVFDGGSFAVDEDGE